jgi:hypothetical protein
MQTAVGALSIQNNFYSRGFPFPSPVRLRSTTCGFAASRGFAAASAALSGMPARGPFFLRPAHRPQSQEPQGRRLLKSPCGPLPTRPESQIQADFG